MGNKGSGPPSKRQPARSRPSGVRPKRASPKVARNVASSPTNHQPQASEPTEPPAPRNRFPVVGVGASAGGLEALSQLLRNLPSDTGMAFVLVQHLDPKHQSQLPEVLSRTTAMPVLTVTDRLRAAPDHST